MNLRSPRSLAPMALVLPLAACVSFGDKTPQSLMTLTAATARAAGEARAIDPARAIQIAVPTVPAALANLRVPVQASDTSLAYLKDAQWSDAPNRLFRNLMAEVVSSRTGRAVVDSRQLSVAPALRLSGGLIAFGLDARTDAVVVTFDATLARGTAPVEARRFEARVPVSAAVTASVAPALNQAANQVAAEVADWIGQ